MAKPSSASAFRSGFVGLVGKPNVGKSTMLNYFLGRKVAITAPTPQTTRRCIKGILTTPEAQAIFIDTPGLHDPHDRLGQVMVRAAKTAFEDADVLVALLDAKTGLRADDTNLLDELSRVKRPQLAALNKIDLVAKPLLLPLIEQCSQHQHLEEIIPVSAATGEQMDVLLRAIIQRLPQAGRWYEDDAVTDQTREFVITELIREQVLQATREEVPHAVAVVLEEFVKRPDGKTIYLRATIYVERPGQKAIIIGKGGRLLQHIGQAARVEIERLINRKVFLDLWVKVLEHWRRDERSLRRLGMV